MQIKTVMCYVTARKLLSQGCRYVGVSAVLNKQCDYFMLVTIRISRQLFSTNTPFVNRNKNAF